MLAPAEACYPDVAPASRREVRSRRHAESQTPVIIMKMDATEQLETLQDGAVEAGLIDALERLVAEAVRDESEPAPHDELLDLLQFAAMDIGDELLGALSADDVHERLDSVLDKDTIYFVNKQALKYERPRSTSRRADLVRFQVRLASVLPTPAATQLQAGLPVLDAWMLAQSRILPRVRRMQDEHGAAEFEIGPATLCDPRIPAEVTLVLVRTLYAVAALFALVRAVQVGRKLLPGVAQELVNRLLEGARSHLSLLAVFPETTVPPEIVPEPLDPVAIDQRHAVHRAEVARRIANRETLA